MSDFVLTSFAKNEYRVSILEKQLEEERKAHVETKMELRIAKSKNFNADFLVPALKENVRYLSVENHKLTEELEKVRLELAEKSENVREKDQEREENDGNDTVLEDSDEEVDSEVDSEDEETSEVTLDSEEDSHEVDSSEEIFFIPNSQGQYSEAPSEFGYKIIKFSEKDQLELARLSENARQKNQEREKIKENDGNDGKDTEDSDEEVDSGVTLDSEEDSIEGVNSEVDSEDEKKSEVTLDSEEDSDEVDSEDEGDSDKAHSEAGYEYQDSDDEDSEVDSESEYKVIKSTELDEKNKSIENLKNQLNQLKNCKREVVRFWVAVAKEKDQHIIKLNDTIKEYKETVNDLEWKISDLETEKLSEAIKTLTLVLKYEKEEFLRSTDELNEFKKSFEESKVKNWRIELEEDKEEKSLQKQMERNREIRKMLNDFKAEKESSKEMKN